MSYYIGIDGGGSKTKAVLCDGDLNILYETQSGPSNFLLIGIEKVSNTILNLIEECCKNQNLSVNEIDNIILGTTGAGRESDATKLRNAIVEKSKTLNIQLNSFNIVSDARIALEGAFSGNSGSILIAGTGSIMFGKDRDGNIHRVGGFGKLIGDEGSGLTLGRKGLNLVARYYDGRGKETLLSNKIKEEFEIINESQLITKVYGDEFEVQKVAPLVIEAGVEGDPLCKKILDEETDELLLHIMSMYKKLNEDKLNVVFIGGTISSENVYSKILKDKIHLYLPNILIKQPDYPPEIGAVIMAKQ